MLLAHRTAFYVSEQSFSPSTPPNPLPHPPPPPRPRGQKHHTSGLSHCLSKLLQPPPHLDRILCSNNIVSISLHTPQCAPPPLPPARPLYPPPTQPNPTHTHLHLRIGQLILDRIMQIALTFQTPLPYSPHLPPPPAPHLPPPRLSWSERIVFNDDNHPPPSSSRQALVGQVLGIRTAPTASPVHPPPTSFHPPPLFPFRCLVRSVCLLSSRTQQSNTPHVVSRRGHDRISTLNKPSKRSPALIGGSPSFV